jgi:muconolactone delta-isomerase
MLFHVHMAIDIPADIDPVHLERLNAISSLPLYPFMRVQVAALARHPGALSGIEATAVAQT